MVRKAVLRIYGAGLRQVLAKSVQNRFKAFLAGLGVTSLLQSSSATALLTSSFVGQGSIALAPALAIMLGADVGTAVVAQIFSFNLSWLSPFFIFFGVALFLWRQADKFGQFGRVMIGLGLIILALQMVMAATRPIAQAAGVKVIFASLSGDLVLDLLIGALFALVCYSSLAVVLLAAALAASGVISLSVAFGLVLGANLGSGVLGLITTATNNRAGRRVAMGNLLFKVIGCVVFAVLFKFAGGEIDRFADMPQRATVHFHMLFNVALAVGFLFFTEPIARLAERLMPDKPNERGEGEPRYLDPAALSSPELALANATREALRMGDLIERMLNDMLGVIRDNDRVLAEETRAIDDDVDKLYSAIKHYLTRISREALDEADGRRWTEIISLTINLEHIGDIVDRIVTDVKDKNITRNRVFSEQGLTEICDLHARLVANLRLGMTVFLNRDLDTARELVSRKAEFRTLERAYVESHFARLMDNTRESMETSSLHIDIVSDMRRINSFIAAIGYPLIEQAGDLHAHRMDAPQAQPASADAVPASGRGREAI